MIYNIALTLLHGVTPTQVTEMLRHGLAAEDIIMHPAETLHELTNNVRMPIIKAIERERESALKAAQQELEFCQKHNIQILLLGSEGYPTRLQECPDAPAVLYYRGTADLNARHVVAIVGTRKITEYGKQACNRITERLATLLPDAIVVSGLAYGVDIHAHRGSIDHGLSTVGVVAHGMDQIYPASHRNDAKRMTTQGGVLTEYIKGTRPLQGNFLRRNRIIAGMADAVIVVESAEHGGSLATARLANQYNRMIFAVPGRINDPYSVGCNNLINKGRALILLSADDLVKEMGWWEHTTVYRSTPQERFLFNSDTFANSTSPQPFSSKQNSIIQQLQGTNGLTAAALAAQTQLPTTEINSLLFDMEMDGIVKVLPGNLYILAR